MTRSALIAVCVLATGSGAYGQQPSLPIEEPLQPDRPDVTNGTHIVGTGLLQIEFGGLYTRSTPVQRAFGSPFSARIGLLDWLEARIGTDGFLTQTDGNSRATGMGNDIYMVHFANGTAEWRIGLVKQGKIGRLALGPQY